jgi:hypothetical protein
MLYLLILFAEQVWQNACLKIHLAEHKQYVSDLDKGNMYKTACDLVERNRSFLQVFP